jgi:hypothetical protein
MINVRVEVRTQTSSFITAVYAENLRQAARIAGYLYPGSAVAVAFPIEPDGFFVAAERHGEHLGLEGAGEAGKQNGLLELANRG